MSLSDSDRLFHSEIKDYFWGGDVGRCHDFWPRSWNQKCIYNTILQDNCRWQENIRMFLVFWMSTAANKYHWQTWSHIFAWKGKQETKTCTCLHTQAPPAIFDLICLTELHSLQTSNQLPLDMALQIKSERDDEGQVSCQAVISSELS